MSEPFPWGAEAPSRRATRLQSVLTKCERRREKLVEEFEAERAKIDAEIRETRQALVATEEIIAIKRREGAAASLTKVIEKLAAKGKIDLDKFSDTDFMESLLVKALADQ